MPNGIEVMRAMKPISPERFNSQVPISSESRGVNLLMRLQHWKLFGDQNSRVTTLQSVLRRIDQTGR